jgi:hypothetical protein
LPLVAAAVVLSELALETTLHLLAVLLRRAPDGPGCGNLRRL